MKGLKKLTAGFLALGISLTMTLNFSGCSKEMSPIGPDQAKESMSQNSVNQSNLEKIVTVNNGKVKLLNFTMNRMSLNKLVTKSTWVTPWYGGILTLEFFDNSYTTDVASNVDAVTQTLKAKTTLQVLPGAVNNFVNISVTMDDELSMLGDIDMEFAPHGLYFNTPALLNIEAYNLDLSNLSDADLGTLGIYYENEETGEWELMECEDIQVNFDQGFIKVINAELPHFSRYAVGGE